MIRGQIEEQRGNLVQNLFLIHIVQMCRTSTTTSVCSSVTQPAVSHSPPPLPPTPLVVGCRSSPRSPLSQPWSMLFSENHLLLFVSGLRSLIDDSVCRAAVRPPSMATSSVAQETTGGRSVANSFLSFLNGNTHLIIFCKYQLPISWNQVQGLHEGEASPGEFPWTCLILNQVGSISSHSVNGTLLRSGINVTQPLSLEQRLPWHLRSCSPKLQQRPRPRNSQGCILIMMMMLLLSLH